ncbi:MAG TPA: DNA translocase FtsK 4TM domain-containing protein, partial [Sulfurovum sp.]
MKITIIITAILFIYAAFSTIFHETALVGDIGKKIGDTNLHLFGYLAYINIFVLFYPLYKLYTDIRARKDIEFYLGWILFFAAIILLSTLVLEPENRGFVGTQISGFMSPLIGKAGLWLLWLMVMALSVVFILDDEFKFSSLNMKRPKFSFSFAWLKNTFVFLGKVLKKVFTNPFASPALEDEMMPVLDEVEEKPEKKNVKKKTSVPKILAK